MTDRDKLRDHIETVCLLTGKTWEERDHSITVIDGPKYQFTESGEIKSIIRGGKSFGPEEVKVLRYERTTLGN